MSKMRRYELVEYLFHQMNKFFAKTMSKKWTKKITQTTNNNFYTISNNNNNSYYNVSHSGLESIQDMSK